MKFIFLFCICFHPFLHVFALLPHCCDDERGKQGEKQWKRYLNQQTQSKAAVCVYGEHPLAGQDIQSRASNSWSRYTTPFDEIKSNVQHLYKPGIPMFLVIKNIIAFCNQGKPCAVFKINLVHVSVNNNTLWILLAMPCEYYSQ